MRKDFPYFYVIFFSWKLGNIECVKGLVLSVSARYHKIISFVNKVDDVNWP